MADWSSHTVRITRCPRCGYELSALPNRHRCPECGFVYDEQMFVLEGWRLPGLREWGKTAFVFGPVAAIAAGVLRYEAGWGWNMIGAILMVAALVVGALYLLVQHRDRSGRRVLTRYLITADGVARFGRHTRTYLWRNYSHVMLLPDGRQGWRLHLYPSWWKLYGPPIVNARLDCDERDAEAVRNEIQRRISAAIRAEAEAGGSALPRR